MSTSAAIFDRSTSADAIEDIRQILEDANPGSVFELKSALMQISEVINVVPKHDVIGFNALGDRLRHELRNIGDRTDGLNSINKVHQETKVSRAYLQEFRDGKAVCMNIMNRLAIAFDIQYAVENYPNPTENIE